MASSGRGSPFTVTSGVRGVIVHSMASVRGAHAPLDKCMTSIQHTRVPNFPSTEASRPHPWRNSPRTSVARRSLSVGQSRRRIVMGSIGEPTSPHFRSSPTLLPDGSTCHEGTNDAMAQLLKVQCFTVTADGYGAGDDQRLDQPFGHLSPQELFTWRSNTASGAFGDGGPQSRGIDELSKRGVGCGERA